MIHLLANAGTALMWAGVFFILPINLLIGAGEGLLLARWLGLGAGRAISVMILANYASMAVGVAITSTAMDGALEWYLGDLPLQRLPWALTLVYTLHFCVTLLVEFPFVWWLGRGKPRANLLRSFLGAQGISNVLILIYFALPSYAGLYRYTEIRRSPDFRKPIAATMYYLSPDASEVRAMRFDTGEITVHTQMPGPRWGRLNAKPGVGDVWSIFIESSSHSAEVVEVSDSPPHRLYPRSHLSYSNDRHSKVLFGPGHYGVVDHRDPDAEPDIWGGWSVRDSIGIDGKLLGLELPYLGRATSTTNFTVLPTNQLVYSADKYIFLLDCETPELALLTNGRGPVVVLDEQAVLPPPAVAPEE